MKKYLITSPEFYTNIPDTFRKKLSEQLHSHMPDFALYRDKTNEDYKSLASEFVDVCSGFENLKAFIHSDVELASTLKAHGVHLTSTQFEKIPHAKSLGLACGISTHTKEEVLKAQELGADYVTYSPIFPSPNKGEPKGVEDLQKLLGMCEVKVFALGGIVESWHVQMLEKTKVYGFASIRYFN